MVVDGRPDSACSPALLNLRRLRSGGCPVRCTVALLAVAGAASGTTVAAGVVIKGMVLVVQVGVVAAPVLSLWGWLADCWNLAAVAGGGVLCISKLPGCDVIIMCQEVFPECSGVVSGVFCSTCNQFSCESQFATPTRKLRVRFLRGLKKRPRRQRTRYLRCDSGCESQFVPGNCTCIPISDTQFASRTCSQIASR
ncbi:hypothetical protein NDU88_005058 [Pleurodeles waltl]|uniref:Uncharacterized protein n=1 Tax=Pleurodeles waltl TaxID=8319 RepID=A0AAV7TA65_PLEWA|nr:hypothetical protein NDU88_005058 [Pleurodeles waltl]